MTLAPCISREVEIADEFERCSDILRRVDFEVIAYLHDRDGYRVSLRRHGLTTSGFGLSWKAAFAQAAEEHRS